MLRKETKDEIKLTRIPRDYLGKLISVYQSKKQFEEKGRMFRSTESKIMSDLKSLYKKTLDREDGDLNNKEIEKLTTIIFRQEHLDSNTKLVINALLFNYFEARVVASLDSDTFRLKPLQPINS